MNTTALCARVSELLFTYALNGGKLSSGAQITGNGLEIGNA